ncbi:hypothetical protein AGLY_012320 [Aphis glycines]|uniref:Uncharacterized protein n=1 Tax=Aphis glycines TaxID=307491 RepID=A0A6G0TAD3_APHGL|nr:hypothetical protein AGLY_012320 [Aphis glycines]
MANFHLMDHDYTLPDTNNTFFLDSERSDEIQEYINQSESMDVDVWENDQNVRPNSYVMISSVHHTEKNINSYYNCMTKINYVRCKEYKNKCSAIRSITVDTNDNTFVMGKLHNHQSRKDETSMRKSRNMLEEQCVAHSPTSYSAKVLYMQAIKKRSIQLYIPASYRRVRKLRKSIYSSTPKNLLHLHQLLKVNENQHFTQTFQAQPNLFYQGPLMVDEKLVGLIFCNTTFIQDFAVELQNSYSLLWVILNGKPESIYTALFIYIKETIPYAICSDVYNKHIICVMYTMADVSSINKEKNHPVPHIWMWVPLCCTIGRYYLCVKFETNDSYHCIRKTILNEDDLSAKDILSSGLNYEELCNKFSSILTQPKKIYRYLKEKN